MPEKRSNSVRDHKRRVVYMYILLTAASLLIALTISYLLHIGIRSAVYYTPFINAAHEIEMSSALAHLWTEEALLDDPDIKYEDVMTQYDKAYRYTEAMLTGGVIDENKFPKVYDAELTHEIEVMQDKMKHSRTLTDNRFSLQREAAAGTEIDQQFDIVFADLLVSAKAIENRLGIVIRRDMNISRSVQMAFILLIFLSCFMAGSMIIRVNARKIAHIEEIKDKNRVLLDTNLKLATTEYQLRATNQQLLASEQQLKASNQQLMANEQQLKAANQQLLASEQQLRISNQQLLASEQQLKASNQQLMANEQQLKAANQQLMASEQALRESENRYSSLFTDMAEGVALHRMIYDENNMPVNYEIIGVNPQYEKILNIPREQVLGKVATEAYGLQEPPFLSVYAEVAETGEPYRFETYFPSMKKHFDISVSSFEKGHFATIFTDITWRKKVDEERMKLQTQMQKLESVGILAGGIAHDFNNLLAGICNNVYLSMINVDRESNIFKYLKSAEKAIHRASSLTHQLLTFSMGGAPIRKTASVVEILEESAEFVLRGTNVSCDYSVPDDILHAEVDPGQINQVIHNLILNAVQSMPGGGTIYISAENAEFAQGAAPPLEAGKYIVITIRDTGVGIAEDQLHKIFDPFYSTKEMGRGLGLSIVYSIIKNHNGHISAQSAPGAGTTFTIFLPASEKKAEKRATEEFESDTCTGKILLMDDEDVIRDSAGKLLSIIGYEVVCAKDGEEAIGLYKKAMDEAQPFDVVILDLTVRGGMGGRETILELLKIDPGVKAVVASGYSNDPVMANYREYGFVDVFNKASRSGELCRTVERVLKG